jgi:hypothetical protein
VSGRIDAPSIDTFRRPKPKSSDAARPASGASARAASWAVSTTMPVFQRVAAHASTMNRSMASVNTAPMKTSTLV